MIDFHSHFLPAIDDGSRSPAQSEQMLRTAFAQGVDVIVATPHFYAWHMDPQRFFSGRQKAVESLCYDGSAMPQILLGAEVAYYDSMQFSEELELFCIGNSRLLLVEMPFTAWTERMVKNIASLPVNQGVTPVLAHVERYLHYGKNKKWLPILREQGVLIQSNCEFFLSSVRGRRAVKMLQQGVIQFLGTDSHNMEDRQPNMRQTIRRITALGGEERLAEVDAAARKLLCL